MDSKTFDAIQRLLNSSDLQKLGAHGGSTYLGAAANTGLSATTIYVREDTSITLCTGRDAAGAVFNFLTGTPNLGINGITLKVGDLYIVPSGYRINAITVASGSIIVYS